MPIYEYQCQKCGTFETTQRITEKPLAKCPTCKGKVRKLISNTSFQLKGTGWYVTDYARKGKNGESKGDSKSEGKSESEARSQRLKLRPNPKRAKVLRPAATNRLPQARLQPNPLYKFRRAQLTALRAPFSFLQRPASAPKISTIDLDLNSVFRYR